MRKIKLVLLLTICLLLSSCGQKPHPITLLQDTSNISKIELINNTVNYNTVQYTLEENEIEKCVEALTESYYYAQHPPCTEYGYIAVRIHYDNGDIETYGSDAIGYKTAEYDGLNGKCYVPFDVIIEIFANFVEDDVISDIYYQINKPNN